MAYFSTYLIMFLLLFWALLAVVAAPPFYASAQPSRTHSRSRSQRILTVSPVASDYPENDSDALPVTSISNLERMNTFTSEMASPDIPFPTPCDFCRSRKPERDISGSDDVESDLETYTSNSDVPQPTLSISFIERGQLYATPPVVPDHSKESSRPRVTDANTLMDVTKVDAHSIPEPALLAASSVSSALSSASSTVYGVPTVTGWPPAGVKSPNIIGIAVLILIGVALFVVAIYFCVNRNREIITTEDEFVRMPSSPEEESPTSSSNSDSSNTASTSRGIFFNWRRFMFWRRSENRNERMDRASWASFGNSGSLPPTDLPVTRPRGRYSEVGLR